MCIRDRPCLRVFPKSGGVASSGESKEALDAFAGAFTVLGPYDLRTAVSKKRKRVRIFETCLSRSVPGIYLVVYINGSIDSPVYLVVLSLVCILHIRVAFPRHLLSKLARLHVKAHKTYLVPGA